MHKQTWSAWLWKLILLWLALALTACATSSAPSPVPIAVNVTRQVQLPPLPASARQPAQPSECLPTCSKALTQERERWQRLLTDPGPQGSSASEVTLPPEKH